MNQNLSDDELIKRILDGESYLFEEIINRYRSRVASLIYNVTGGCDELEDIAQEVFVSVYRNLGLFEHRSQLGTWIYRITVNKCRDWQRKTIRRRSGQVIELYGTDRASPADATSEWEERDTVRKAVDGLPERYRPVIILYYYHDLSCQEIAEVLGMPKKTVETRLIRGRGIIARKLESGGEAVCTETNQI